MCGIVGIIGQFNKDVREKVVQEMNQAITHRGPDETGWYSDEYCTLAMTRLSIIDLFAGKQPIYNMRRTSLIFFNGEIYNYRELRNNLIKKGYIFKTNSDTEVIIHLYDEFGERLPTYLKGMFAFCIYDLQKKSFFFARDRFGEKPFYYCLLGDGLAFSSEVASLLENPRIPRTLNRRALPYYLNVSYVPEPQTLLKDIYTLPPGHQMTFRNGRINLKDYFKINYQTDSNIRSINDAVDFVTPIFEQAVKRQMICDVPLGAFLSGGIDSSSIVAVMQQHSSEPVKTFNVKFEDATYDESPIAREVAKFLGSDHHEIFIPNAEFTEEIFWKIIDHVGLPFPDSSAIPTYYITKEIRKHVTVALSGDGGDELFAGYPLFDWYLKIIKLRKVPYLIRLIGGATTQILKRAPLFSQMSQIRQISKALELSSVLDDKKLAIDLHSMYTGNEISSLNESLASDYSDLKLYPHEYSNWTPLRRIMYYRVKHDLALDMLIKVDRMSMANSLEVRAPFLDSDLFEASAQIPEKFLFNNGVNKLVLRKMMKNQLPECVFNHPKSGFSIPLHRYQNKTFERLADELFLENSPIQDLFDKSTLEKIKNNGLKNKRSDSQISVYKSSHQLWSMMQLAGWMKRFNVSC